MKLGVNDYNDPTEGGVIIVRMQYCQYGLLTQCWCYFHFTAGWLGCICDTKAETLTDRTGLSSYTSVGSMVPKTGELSFASPTLIRMSIFFSACVPSLNLAIPDN